MITQYDLPRNFYRSRARARGCMVCSSAVVQHRRQHVMRRQDVIDFLGELTQTANAKTRGARSRSCASQFGTVRGAVTGAIVAGARLAGVILEAHYSK